MLKNLIVGLIAIFSVIGLSQAQVNTDTVLTEQKKVNILKFMHLTKSDEMVKATLDNMIQPYQTGIAAAPPTYWNNLKMLFPFDTLTMKMIDVYNKHYSTKELLDMNKFLESSAGIKFMNTIPAVSDECWNLIDKWATETSVKLKDKLIQDGYINIQR